MPIVERRDLLVQDCRLVPRALPVRPAGHDAQVAPGTPGAFGGITLAICLESEEAVTAALAEAATHGARILKPAEKTDWGGFSGYFADPDGHPWEIDHNPFFPINPDGPITIP
jgi:uncharacterized protein